MFSRNNIQQGNQTELQTSCRTPHHQSSHSFRLFLLMFTSSASFWDSSPYGCLELAVLVTAFTSLLWLNYLCLLMWLVSGGFYSCKTFSTNVLFNIATIFWALKWPFIHLHLFLLAHLLAERLEEQNQEKWLFTRSN